MACVLNDGPGVGSGREGIEKAHSRLSVVHDLNRVPCQLYLVGGHKMPYSIKLCLTLGGSLGALVMQTESKAEEAGLGGVSSLHFTVYPPLSEHLEGGRWAPLNYLPRKEVRRTNPVLMCSQAKWHVLFPPPTDLSCALLP